MHIPKILTINYLMLTLDRSKTSRKGDMNVFCSKGGCYGTLINLSVTCFRLSRAAMQMLGIGCRHMRM